MINSNFTNFNVIPSSYQGLCQFAHHGKGSFMELFSLQPYIFEEKARWRVFFTFLLDASKFSLV